MTTQNQIKTLLVLVAVLHVFMVCLIVLTLRSAGKAHEYADAVSERVRECEKRVAELETRGRK